MRVRILDDAGQEVSPGQEGEMVVSGRQLASAYWQGPDKLVPIPQDGFRNGDLARRDDEGYVYITGRKKDIIIKGGVNIASLEITNCLLEHPDVADAGTLAARDDIYGEVPVGFVAPRPGRPRTKRRSWRTAAPGWRPSRCPRPSSSSTPFRRTRTARSTATRSPRSGSDRQAADRAQLGMQAVTVISMSRSGEFSDATVTVVRAGLLVGKYFAYSSL